jgi:hypothetical protein
MWNPRRAAAYAVVAIALVAPATAVVGSAGASAGASGAARGDREGGAAAAERRLDLNSLVTSAQGSARDADPTTPPPSPEYFQGVDGLYYYRAEKVVDGGNGTVYFGEEFDSACYWGGKFDRALRRLAKLARVIERSGRRAVFTVGPNKSAANKRDLPATLPHSYCDALGISAQDKALDSFKDVNYLPMRRELAKHASAGREVYWHLDTHWTTVGGSEFAQALAHRLSPKVAKLQRYRAGEQTIFVDLNYLGLLDNVYETGPTRLPDIGVRVRPVNGSAAYDLDDVSPSLEWASGPGKRTVGGRTLLLGDSFMYRALPSLMPLFHHGRFIWAGNQSIRDTARAIRKSDTVVLEVVQRYAPLSVLSSGKLRRAVAGALR